MRLVVDTIEFGIAARCRSGTRSASAATTSARPAHGGAGAGLHAGRRLGIRRGWALARGLDVDDFAPRLSFFFNAHNDFFEEIAKYRAARRIWAREMQRDVRREGSALVDAALPHADGRGHADRAAAGDQHRARGASRRWPPCWAARRACTPTAWTRRWPCPREKAVTIALRTQQVIADESGRGQHGRSAGRLVLRRGADRPDGSRRPTTTSGGSRSWAA